MEIFLIHLSKSAALITIFYSFYKFFLQKETFFQSIRYFLIGGILFSFAIPFIAITKCVEVVPLQGTLLNTTADTVLLNTASIDWLLICAYIYSIVALCLFIKFLIQLTSIGMLIYKNRYTKIDQFYFVETHSKISPFSFFNFIVYNPSQFKPEELKQVLAHEKSHVLQRHSLDSLLSNVLVILLWFNPFTWLYKQSIEQNLEFIADECAQNTIESKHSYQQLLLKTTMPNSKIALANNFYNSLLKKRIIMLHKQRSKNKSQWKFALMLPLLFTFVFAFNTNTVAQQKKSTKSMTKMKIDVFAMALNKESSKRDLKKISSSFLEKGLTVNFSNIKRNSNNAITTIKIDAKATNGKAAASHASDLENGINPIQISYDRENNNLSIGSESDYRLNEYSYKKNGKGNSFIFVSNDDDDKNILVTKKRSKKVIVETEYDEDGDENHDEEIIRITSEKGEHKNKTVIVSSNDNKEPLIFLNGKEITKKAMEDLDTDSIKSINVIKGAKAIEKYGKKAKDGVIVITSK